MILMEGKKRVGQSEKIASRTAVARDRTGRIYVLWAQGPYSLWRLADILDRSGLEIDRAITMDGGGEAQLAIRLADTYKRVAGVTGLGLLRGPVALPAVIAVHPRDNGAAE